MDSITRCSSTRQMVASDEDTTPTYALDALVANLSIDATPVGKGRTAQEAERKFLAEFGLTSSTGANASNTPYKDKMILYAAVVVQEGTGDYVGRRSPLQWNQGVLGCVNNAVRQATFVDYCSGQEASITGHPQWGIRQHLSDNGDDEDNEEGRSGSRRL